MSNGRFITFEGGEGAGKSTQLKRLAARLQAGGRDVVATREVLHDRARDDVLHLIGVERTALQFGANVVADPMQLHQRTSRWPSCSDTVCTRRHASTLSVTSLR